MDSTPSRQIDVDLLHLRDTREGLVRDTDEALLPGISDAGSRIVCGATFGEVSPSGEVDASQHAMSNAITVLLDNGHRHVEHARQVIAFLEAVLTRYSTADELSRLDLDTVLGMFAKSAAAPPLTIAETRGRFA